MKITYLDLYHCFNETIMSKKPTIVKVGVDGLDDLIKAREMYPDADIMAFEADEVNYHRWNGTSNKNKICKMVNCAVGLSGVARIYRYKNHVGNSTTPRHTFDKGCELVSDETVESISITHVTKKGYIDLLILNCEGGELPIMRDLYDEKVRDKIGQICVSFHDPRIYPTAKKMEILNKIGKYYTILRGDKCPRGGIADYLMIRKV